MTDSAPDHLVLSWRAPEFVDTGAGSATVHLTGPFNSPMMENLLATEMPNVIARWTLRDVRYQIDNLIDLTPSQVAEICYFVMFEADDLWKAMIAYLQGPCGVTLVDRGAATGSAAPDPG